MSRLNDERGNATVELLVSLVAVSPLLLGIPLLGKQLDIKHKAYDAVRYSVWERTVWSGARASNSKSEQEISLESRDRVFGNPWTGVIPAHVLRDRGVSENPLWRDMSNRRMLTSSPSASDVRIDERASPVEVGSWLAPGIAHGQGAIKHAASALQVRDLDLDREGFANATVSVSLHPSLIEASQGRTSLGGAYHIPQSTGSLTQQAGGAILSDTWSARDEEALRRRVDHVTTNEMIERLEQPGRAIGMQAREKGAPLYGEGQYGWDPDLNPRSTALPDAYIRRH